MADSVASTQSRPSRGASKKRRQATVSTETENKLARAARSARRLAQLSDAARDDSTLDLFPDDPTRATLEAMNIDIRQGTLHGFELPDVVLAAVGVIDSGDGALPDTRAARRGTRAAKADEPVPVSGLLSGLEIEPAFGVSAELPLLAEPEVAAVQAALADAKPAAAVEKTAGASSSPVASAASSSTLLAQPQSPSSSRDALAPLTSAMAAATVARSVIALRQAAEPGASKDPKDAMTEASAATSTDVKPTRRFDATFAKAATAARDGSEDTGASTSAKAAAAAGTSHRDANGVNPSANQSAPTADATRSNASAASTASTASTASKQAEPNAGNRALPDSAAPAQSNPAFAEPWREARRAEAAAAALRAAPELDRARATAFADTVDALYGVIADQRRAADDHSRRMKWLLPIVVGALLGSVAIGITQAVLLMRLTRETTAQQQRIEQLMQSQQAAMANLLDTHKVLTDAVAANAAAASAVSATPSSQAAAAPGRPKHATHAAQYARKPKPGNTTH